MTSEKWLPIPVAPKYEINQRGDVRNKKTGLVLVTTSKPKCSKSVSLYISTGKKKWFTINSLLWLVYGRIKKKSNITLPVIVSKGNQRHYFDSVREAAKFIARDVDCASNTVRMEMWRRREEIYGWRINYQR